MIKITNVTLTLDERAKIGQGELCEHKENLKAFICQKYSINPQSIADFKITRESIDARKVPCFIISVSISLKNAQDESLLLKRHKNMVHEEEKDSVIHERIRPQKLEPVIVGFGPAGIFAALEFLKHGVIPTVIEQGEKVDERNLSIQHFYATQTLNEFSNIQFGEGGAGTFSDAKLSTGIKNINIKYVLETLIKFGAPECILYKAMPHIGTDIIQKVVKNIRTHLQEQGVKILFNTQLEDVVVKGNEFQGICAKNVKTGESFEIDCKHLLLCIGHSARQTVKMLYRKGVSMTPKPFAIGLRIEHLQDNVNKSRYHKDYKHSALPNAPYNVNVKTPDGRGVYSFCMCPGGEVVMASSEPKAIVVNGMSYYARDQVNANSALLVGVNPNDFGAEHALGGFEFQEQIERKAFDISSSYLAPVQTVGNFLGLSANQLMRVQPSCKIGFTLCNLKDILPTFVSENLAYGLPLLSNQLACFKDLDAVFTGVETRSSSPVRIYRDDFGETSIKGIFGCGEGAGFSGGIMSSAIDGIRISDLMCRKE